MSTAFAPLMSRPILSSLRSIGTLVGLIASLCLGPVQAQEPTFELDESGQAVETSEEPTFELDESGQAVETSEEPTFELDESGQAVETSEEPTFELDESGQALETSEEPSPPADAESTGATVVPEVGETVLKEVEIFGTRPRVLTPLPGVILDEGQSSTNIQQSTGEEIRDSGAVSTTQFLNEQLQSITVQDNTGNPFQQDVVFRGFSASPLLATPQGLSVYLDGVRVNEPFGQVINWDLIPLNAIENLALIPGSNPLFGLNTLGGALSLGTKSGFTSPGVDASQTLGSWGRNQTEFAAGASDEHVAGLLAVNHLREDGWRRNSPSAINQAFARADVRNSWGQITVQGLHADNELFGGGLIPYEDFLIDPSQTYTSPDAVFNKLDHFWATARADVTDTFSASVLSYHRSSDQDTINGDFWDDWVEAAGDRIAPCDIAPGVPAPPGPSINGAFNTPGGNPPTNTGISGCIVNGSLGTSNTSQDAHGLGLQLNWVTDRNQLVVGATYDSDATFFQQMEQLGFIEADRTVVADPNRPYQQTTIIETVIPDNFTEISTVDPEAALLQLQRDRIAGLAEGDFIGFVFRYVETGCADSNNQLFQELVDLGNGDQPPPIGGFTCAPGDYEAARPVLLGAGVPDDLVTEAALQSQQDRATREALVQQGIRREVIPGQTFVNTNTSSIPASGLVGAAGRPVLQNKVNGSNRTMATYFFDVWTITPKVNLSLGARFSVTRVTTATESEFRQNLLNFNADRLARTIPRCADPDDPNDTALGDQGFQFFACRSETHQYSALNPAVGISVDVSDGINVFGNLSRGSRTPSSVELACAKPDAEFLAANPLENRRTNPQIRPGCTIPTSLSNDPFLAQVRSTTYELGTRGRLSPALSWDFAVYQTDLKDDILFVALGFANRGVFQNFGRTRRRGIEFGLKGARERFDWFINYSLVQATFQSQATVINLSNSTSDKDTVVALDQEEGQFFIEPGDVLPGVPEHSIRAGLTVETTRRSKIGLNLLAQAASFVRGNENNDHQPGGTDNAPESQGLRGRRFRDYVGEGEIDAFWVLNLDAEYNFTDHLKAFVQIDNLLDTRYNTAGQLGVNVFPSIFPSDPAYGVRDPSGFSNNSNDWTHSTFVGPGAPRAGWVGIRLSY